MPYIDQEQQTIHCKIVYYGPGLGGKTTNMQYIHDAIHSKMKSSLISVPSETDRTLFCNFSHPEFPAVDNLKLRFHLYTAPGPIFYHSARWKSTLKGVDGIVFVADSQFERLDANIEHLYSLKNYLKDHNLDIDKLPAVLQLNKKPNLSNITSVEALKKELMYKPMPVFEAVAYKGIGVMETFRAIAALVLADLKAREALEHF